MFNTVKINLIWFLATLITLDELDCFLYKINKKSSKINVNDNDYVNTYEKNQIEKDNHLVFPLYRNDNVKIKQKQKEYFYDFYEDKLSFEEPSDSSAEAKEKRNSDKTRTIRPETTNKNYLQDFIENENVKTSTQRVNTNLPLGKCNLETVEVSLKLENCGRIILNTTACSGLCKSSEQVITNTNLKKRSCWACKPHKFVNIRYEIKCVDNTKSFFNLRAISACSCFKHSDVILPLTAKKFQ